MRDNFQKSIIETLAKRAGQRCSNPYCKIPTVGPDSNPEKFINIGVAAHVTAASSGGKRYNPCLTEEQRGNILNGIWLCQKCAHLIDTDASRFPEELLHYWKRKHEESVLQEIYGGKSFPGPAHMSLVEANQSIVPTGKKDAALLLFQLKNNHLLDVCIRSLQLETIEFLSKMPMGQAISSLVAEVDLGDIIKYSKKKTIPLLRVLHPNASDSFSIGLSAPSLNGFFCIWRLRVTLECDCGHIEMGECEVHIPGADSREGGSFFEGFRNWFCEVYYSNEVDYSNKTSFLWFDSVRSFVRDPLSSFEMYYWYKAAGLSWFDMMRLFVRDPLWDRGFSFHYMFPMLYYSGPENFLKKYKATQQNSADVQ